MCKKHRYGVWWGQNMGMGLRSSGIETLLMTGDATNGCVESTTRDAFCNDFYVVTVADCCGDFDVGRHEFSLRKMEQAYGYVVQSEEIGDIWRRGEFLPAGPSIGPQPIPCGRCGRSGPAAPGGG